MLSLDIAIATHRPDGITRLARMNYPTVPGVRYVVSWQNHEDAPIPSELNRDDFVIYRFDGQGQSANRNNAIDHCTADIVLNSDDDLTLYPDGIIEIIKTFELNPQLDVATFRAEIDDARCFPAEAVRLTTKYPRGYFATAIEIAFRCNAIGSLRFCPELGLASPRLHGGEDEMFLYSAIKRGLDCRFFPIIICRHEAASTGTRKNLPAATVRAMGCIIALTNPLTAFLRLPLKAWRLWRGGQSSMPRALAHLTHGALMAPGILRRNHATLW